jgi:hypothetical protein
MQINTEPSTNKKLPMSMLRKFCHSSWIDYRLAFVEGVYAWAANTDITAIPTGNAIVAIPA